MSVVNIGRESVSSFYAGHGTVGLTPAQLAEIPLDVLKHVVIHADAGNGSTITVGPSSAQAANGYVLAAGEFTPPIYVDNLNKIWLVAADTDQEYQWVAN
jgi:hypothetical protein